MRPFRERTASAKVFQPGDLVELDCTKAPWVVEVIEDRGDTVFVRVVSSGQTVLAPKSSVIAD